MPPIDIAQLVRDALKASGCNDQQIGSFDGHSTIELEFNGIPSVHIAGLETGVWFWARIAELTPAILQSSAEHLLGFIMHGFGPARTEQLQVADIDGWLELRVLLSDASTGDAESMAQAIEAFVHSIDELQELLRR
ncbi:Invasion protein B family [Pseudomonas typographi]|uniref:Invasion protein B family n=1 Tax=Pseudomonas typographi TaxID=2715964 RepID=A0ABR7Z218_9PSED|nr:Invasion protein B family [Pseudomonas typographi]MBD1552383.1 Invasion protein B family [Pseudomonas typographi]MBD1587222.1 Invasion protein B family [Pseudomonas typographi]MBD1599536.1 Invasion protein B family [Pseudomonas typographi]